LKDYLLLVVNKIGKTKRFVFLNSILSFSEEWITAIEIINRQITPHLQQQQSIQSDGNMNMVTNDDADNTENEYPLMSEVFTRRPVREKRFRKSYLMLYFKANK
jgi:hypothetical protein